MRWIVFWLALTGCGGSCSDDGAQTEPSPGKERKVPKGKAPKGKAPKGKAPKSGKAKVEQTTVKVFLADPTKSGTEALVEVERQVGKKTPERNAVYAMFRGPNPEEKERGLELAKNGAIGFHGLKIEDGVAKLQLRGACESPGERTIYDHISATLKQFDTVEFVQIAAPEASLPEDLGKVDHRPDCLQP